MIPSPQSPDSAFRLHIEKQVRANSQMCWNCSACDAECPVNIATNRLRPQKIVRLANLGFLQEMLTIPEIWYCFTCRRCNRVCPNQVKPYDLIDYARRVAVVQQHVSLEAQRAYQRLFSHFQQVRWHMVARCLDGNGDPSDMTDWHRYLNMPVSQLLTTVKPRNLFKAGARLQISAATHQTHMCFTCHECASACPLSYKRPIFDPVSIFRMVNLGLEQELLRSPAIWLCIECGRCTEACTQGVEGHRIIQNLKELALAEGNLDPYLPLKLEASAKVIYPGFLDEIDRVIGYAEGRMVA